jgi:KDO2-lipid IV(A) lauroyltransferase
VLSWLLYHFILIPLSWLPLTILYGFSQLAYWLLYYIIGYRKTVVDENLKLSFPNLSEKERLTIKKSFYRFLATLLAEAIKNLTISKKQLQKRLKVINPELMDKLYKNNQSVILMSNHFYNWEFLISAQNILFKHQAIGIGTPLSNGVLNNLINKQRARFGMHIAHAKNYKTILKSVGNIPTATLVLGDQSPRSIENAYWTDFLGRETAFFFGAEIMANQNNAAVVYVQFNSVKRGYYTIKLKQITETPKQESYGYITEQYVKNLASDIRQNPPYWLWSHKRWKISIPNNLEVIKTNHKKRFLEKFRDKI